MITLQFKRRHSELKVGDIVHFKIIENVKRGPGRWRLTVDDVTPLPGAEPDGYGCHICGIIEEAKPDGSLPDGWSEKKYEEGSSFVCSNTICQEEPICRVCGCTREQACLTSEAPCYWVKPDLCSACAAKVK